jgi:hypothetical protein
MVPWCGVKVISGESWCSGANCGDFCGFRSPFGACCGHHPRSGNQVKTFYHLDLSDSSVLHCHSLGGVTMELASLVLLSLLGKFRSCLKDLSASAWGNLTCLLSFTHDWVAIVLGPCGRLTGSVLHGRSENICGLLRRQLGGCGVTMSGGFQGGMVSNLASSFWVFLYGVAIHILFCYNCVL